MHLAILAAPGAEVCVPKLWHGQKRGALHKGPAWHRQSKGMGIESLLNLFGADAVCSFDRAYAVQLLCLLVPRHPDSESGRP